MLEAIINQPVDRLLEKGLELARVRHEAIANNLANVDTPGYKRKDVDFAAVFAAELARVGTGAGAGAVAGGAVAAREPVTLGLARTQAGHLAGNTQGVGAGGEVSLIEDGSTSVRVDGNNVDIDDEMAKLAENSIYYQALSQQVGRRLRLMLTIIDEGRR